MWTVFDFLKRFLNDLWRAIVFAAIEFDENLQMTKTTTSRFLIWAVIGTLLLILAGGLVFLIWHLLDSIEVGEL